MPRCLTASGEPLSTPLSKRFFTGPNLIVVLGLEGSGHHGICAVLSANGAAATVAEAWHALERGPVCQ